MIVHEEFEAGGIKYDRRLEPTDWRYSAAAVGITRCSETYDFPILKEGRYFRYRYRDIAPQETEDGYDVLYIKFAEKYFQDRMHHVTIEMLLKKSSFFEEDIKLINEKISSNTVMKKVFKGVKFDGKNRDEIERIISENRLQIIRETFKNSPVGYKKFINLSSYRKDEGETCRLVGFHVDPGRKTRAVGFGFDKKARVTNDAIEFDFIPFGFSRGNSSIFINNNVSIESLVKANNELDFFLKQNSGKNASWHSYFYKYSEGGQFIDYDVEVIAKENETNYYETLFVRKTSVGVFKKLGELLKYNKSSKYHIDLEAALKRFIKVNDDYYINIIREVTNAIINETALDDLIERLLKVEYSNQDRAPETFLIKNLIKINKIIYGEFKNKEGEMENMDNSKVLNVDDAIKNKANKKKSAKLEWSSGAAWSVVQYFINNKQEKKIKTYRQRLANTLVYRDYDRFIEIMIQLSSYTEIAFPFMHTLIEDFEENKNLAYDFVNSLIDTSKKKEEDSNKGGNNNEK